jgi:hypothetical protein
LPTFIKAGADAFKFLGDGIKKSADAVLSFGKALVTSAAKFAVYIAKLIAMAVAGWWAMAVQWPAGTAAALGLAAVGGAAVAAIVMGIKSLTGGGEDVDTGMPSGAEGAVTAASEAQATEGASLTAVPEAQGGGLFRGPDTGYLVKLHGTERVTKEEAGGGAPVINVNITGNEISIPDEGYLNKLSEEISLRISREWDRKLRYV